MATKQNKDLTIGLVRNCQFATAIDIMKWD